ncbi:MAG: peptidyl-prolyl cis-trans isomerase [Chthoniobacter sp.]|uniref:peptidyl-prolyl cis-trans isomerase n=1 Tax=Chthoniobacter sp. TaxID=2510640 RepID=UPI0032A6341D
MVNIFRRYQQPLMIIVTLVTIITFAGLYSHTDFLDKGASSRGGTIYGRTVPLPLVQRAARKGDLCRQLAQEEMFQSKRTMAELYESLAVTRQEAKENFTWNSIILKHEADLLGVVPTEDEIFEATQALSPFQTNGVYDSSKYALFSQNVLPHLGFTTDDLAELIGDSLRLQKVKALLGSTVAPSEGEIRESFIRLNQKTEAAVVRFKLDDFLATTQVPEEDVKKLYEERKGSLKTDELRKVKYVAFILPTTDKPLDGKARTDKLTQLQKQAEDFAVAMTDKNAKLDEVATKTGAKIQESADFSIAKPPEALEASSEVAAAAFKLNQQDPNSDVIETPRGYYVLQLANVTPPRPLAYEEAKAELTDTLKRERAQEALNLKATDVRNKIEAAMKGGQAFAAAVAEAGVTSQDFPAFSQKDPKVEPPNSGEIMQTASELNEGQLSTVVPTPDGSLIVYVTKRLPIDENQLKAEKGKLAEAISGFQRYALFQQWLKLRRAAAQLQSTFHG